MLLPLSTRKEFKKELRARAGVKAAMKAAAAWAASALNVGVTAAGVGDGGKNGCEEASADESGKSRASDIGKKRADRAAKAGHSHSHSHSHGGHAHSHSHGGHSHGAGESVSHGHIGHTHGSGGGGGKSEKSDRKSISSGRGRNATAPGKKTINVVDHRSSGWAHSGSKRAVRGLSAKEAERKVGSSDEGGGVWQVVYFLVCQATWDVLCMRRVALFFVLFFSLFFLSPSRSSLAFSFSRVCSRYPQAVKAARRETRELAAMSSGISAGRADELVRRPGLRGRGRRTGDDEDDDDDRDYEDSN